ncbi:hypothetical protein M404DRAFT_156273, partial [Pisolithus tinctorius Marx 270]
MPELWGRLTRQEVLEAIPSGTLSPKLQKWADLGPAILLLPKDVQDRIRLAAAAKDDAALKRKREANAERQARFRAKRPRRGEPSVPKASIIEHNEVDSVDTHLYMQLPTTQETRNCIARFIDATGNDALRRATCIICARESMEKDGEMRIVIDIPNIQQHLRPQKSHPAHSLWRGLLILGANVDDAGHGWACHDCLRALHANRLPHLALNNNLWLGEPPLVLRRLTFVETLLIARHYPRCYVFKLYPRDGSRSFNPRHLQRAMAGNVTLYEINSSAVADMVQGRMLPHTVRSMSNILAITFVGTKRLPTNWLNLTFRVRRDAIREALQWLQENNNIYCDVDISEQRINELPNDDVPPEIEAMIRLDDDELTAVHEREGYAMSDGIDCEGMSPPASHRDVLPLHVLAVSDTDLTKTSSSELMAHALANLNDSTQEGGYVVRHGTTPITDFGSDAAKNGCPNPLAATFPTLFPYGIGGIEDDRSTKLSLREHCQWALQYHDKHFATHHSFPFVVFALIQKRDVMRSARLQMQRKDFERDALAHQRITNARVRALHHHVTAANGRVEGSDNARARYRGMIWGTCLVFGGPSLWLTINPVDIHDPIVQVFAGEEIDMDNFNSSLGPDSNHCAENIASNPYAAALFFNFIIHQVLDTLFGIQKRGSRTTSHMGVLGRLSAYFGVVEAQGR